MPPTPPNSMLEVEAYRLQLRSHGPLEALHCELCQAGGIEFCEFVNGVA